MGELHVGRSWTGHPLEDACPCPKAPCGLVIQEQAIDTCSEHALGAFKSIRQGHPSDRCPAAETMSTRDKVAMALHAAEADCLERGEVMGYTVLADAAIAAHLDALKAARIELVELPDVSREDLYHQYWISIAPNASIKYEYDGSWDSPEHVREFAAALLAAADVAEAS